MFWHLPHPRAPQGFPFKCSPEFCDFILPAWRLTHQSSWGISHPLAPVAVLHPKPTWLHFFHFKAHVSRQNKKAKLCSSSFTFTLFVRPIPPLPRSGLILFFFLLRILEYTRNFLQGAFLHFCVYLWICSHLHLTPHLCSAWTIQCSFFSY